MADSKCIELDRLIEAYHAQERIRVWSMVITLFGDAIIPRGGELWLGSLLDLMARLGVEASAVRAAMSRLTADGWLIRERVGRKSFYRLAPTGEMEFEAAAAKIYGPKRAQWSGEWTIIVLATEAGDARDARRAQLRADGYGSLGPTVFIRPDNPANRADLPVLPGDLVFHSSLDALSDPQNLLAQAWQLDKVEKHYDRFVEAFQPLEQRLNGGFELDPVSAMAARSLLIHQFRRLALRDPLFPLELTPAGWNADAARRLASSLYAILAVSSEQWLDGCRGSSGAVIPKPHIDMAKRFVI